MPIAFDAAADACNDDVGLASRGLRHLLDALASDDALEVAHHHRIRMRAGDRTDDVERRLDVGHPVAHRLVQRVLQRLGARFNRNDAGAEHRHPEDVLRLPLHVLRAHVDDALHAEARGDRRRGDAVHAGARLRDHARLAEPLRKQRLADAVVDLVRAGVIQVLALEPDLRAAEHLRPALGVVDGRRPADIMRELVLELGDERRVVAIVLVLRLQLVERAYERLGDEHAAVRTEVSALVGQVVGDVTHLHCAPPR